MGVKLAERTNKHANRQRFTGPRFVARKLSDRLFA
jgi:hypothetical protein